MLKEQVEIIKEAEKKAEALIDEGKSKAREIIRSADDKAREIIEKQQSLLESKLLSYSEEKKREKEKKIEDIGKTSGKAMESLEKKSAGEKISAAAEKVWEDIEKEFFRP